MITKDYCWEGKNPTNRRVDIDWISWWFLDFFVFCPRFSKVFLWVQIYNLQFSGLDIFLGLDNASNRSEERNTSLWDYTGRQFLGSLGNGLLLYPPWNWEPSFPSFLGVITYNPYFGGLTFIFPWVVGVQGLKLTFRTCRYRGNCKRKGLNLAKHQRSGAIFVCFRCRVSSIEIVMYCPPWKISNINICWLIILTYDS